MDNLLHIILNKHILLNRRCSKILLKDGIVDNDLVFDNLDGLFEKFSISNIKYHKNKNPSIGETAGIVKNLDHYQFVICSEIPSIPDSFPIKKQAQKNRIIILAAFSKIVSILSKGKDENALKEWNSFAKVLLTEVSETVFKFRSGVKDGGSIQNVHLSKFIKYLEMDEQNIEILLNEIY